MHRLFQPKLYKFIIKVVLARLFFGLLPRRFKPFNPDRTWGINLLGYYRGDLGLGEALRYAAKSMNWASVPFLIRQLTPTLKATQTNFSVDHYVNVSCTYPINCLVINPDMLYRIPFWVSWKEWSQRYNIGYWFWELPKFPGHWDYALSLVDEIWVNTEFNAVAMKKVFPNVIKIPFAIEFDLPSAKFNREYFHLPNESFVFLTTFDFNSSIARKNPQAVISAFLLAFPDDSAPVQLIVKSINCNDYHLAFSELKELAKGDRRIQFLENQLESEEMRGLLRSCDSYVSLHRSEGLGLTMAEAMYLGKPVIATAYSGNMEFMSEATACLVPYAEIPVPMDAYVSSQNQIWADANIDGAARAMQKLVSDPQYRETMGDHARAYLLENHSFKVMGNAIAKRISEIKHLLSGAPN